MARNTSKNVSSFRAAGAADRPGGRNASRIRRKAAPGSASAAVAPGDRKIGDGAGDPPGRTNAVQRDAVRTRFLHALRELDTAWFETFRATGLSDLYFSRLFTELWLRGGEPISKTDAYACVTGVGVQTAMKYVKRAIEEGYLEELDNPLDGRSRLIRMSPKLRRSFEALVDRAAKAFGMA